MSEVAGNLIHNVRFMMPMEHIIALPRTAMAD